MAKVEVKNVRVELTESYSFYNAGEVIALPESDAKELIEKKAAKAYVGGKSKPQPE